MPLANFGAGLLGIDHIARYAFVAQGGKLARVARREGYEYFESLYFNTYYEEQGFDNPLAAMLKAAGDLSGVRGIYNPVSEIVDAYKKYALKGVLRPAAVADWRDVVVEGENAADLEAAILRMWAWSNFEIEKSLIPYYAANLGDALIMVLGRGQRAATATSPAREGRVWMEVHHPKELIDVDFDSRGNIVYAKYETQRSDTRTADDALGLADRKGSYKYTAIYTKTEFVTLKDDRPFGYGGMPARYPNPYGFVPLVLVQHKRSGDEWGLNAYHNSIGPISEAALMASIVGDLIAKFLSPQWAIEDAGKVNTLPRDGKAWILERGHAKALQAEIDIAGAYVHIGRILDALTDKHPELTLPKVRQHNATSGVAVRALLFDLIETLGEARENYDAGIYKAVAMGLSMGRVLGMGGMPLEGFEGVGEFERGELDFTFRRPPILPPSEIEQLQEEATASDLTRRISVNSTIATGATVPQTTEGDPAALAAAALLAKSGGQ